MKGSPLELVNKMWFYIEIFKCTECESKHLAVDGYGHYKCLDCFYKGKIEEFK